MKRSELLLKQQAILNAAKAESRDLTPEEQAEFDEIQRQLDAMDGDPDPEPDPGQRGIEQEDAASIAQRAVEAERQRSAEITELCRSFGMDPTTYINNGSSVDEARAAVLEELKKKSAPINAKVTADEGDKFRDMAADRLALRGGVNIEKPADGADKARNFSLKDLGQECLIRGGMDSSKVRSMSSDEVFNELTRQAYNPTAAFPAILDTAVRKSIVEMYNAAGTTFQLWTQKGSKSDFKEAREHDYVMNSIGDLEEVPENGELKNSVPKTELLPTSRLKTYGQQFTMTRQAFINDDIGIVTRIPGLYAVKAKKTIDKLVYKKIMDNGNIFDGVALFHAKHKNLGTAAAPSAASLKSMINMMMLQTDQFGEPIYVTPRHIVTGVGYGFDFYQLLHSANLPGTNNNDVNPLANLPYELDVIESPMINALAGNNPIPWFLVAEASSAPSIGVNYLNGREVPTIRRMETPGVLGFVWDIYLDADVAVKDFRGISKNAGV